MNFMAIWWAVFMAEMCACHVVMSLGLCWINWDMMPPPGTVYH
jgi:hypothetical protein